MLRIVSVLTVLALGLLVAGFALAGTATVTYTPADSCTDGTKWPAGTKAAEDIEWAACPNGAWPGTAIGSQAAPTASSNSVTINSPTLTEGQQFCFRAFTNLTSDFCGVGKRRSGPSNLASKVIPIADHGGPSAPSITTVSTTAYVLKRRWFSDRTYLQALRTVKLTRGEACGAPVPGHRGYSFVSGDVIGRCRAS
jgi:hypothetical protein